jgi:hypothetical protein
MNLAGVVQQLTRERNRAKAELERLEAAITALGTVGSGFRKGQRKGRVSAAARARMAAAQRARRARESASRTRSKAPVLSIAKRRFSAAGLASMRAVQRARWAKRKKQKAA